MIIYNVTCHVDDEIVDEWREWMEREHLPEVMETGKFISFEFFRVRKHNEEDPGQSFAIMYRAESMEQYQEYVRNHAGSLKGKTAKRYGDKVSAFRTILELI